jgi:cell division protein FtsL
MSPTTDPTVENDVAQGNNPADSKDSLKEAITNLAQEMRLGFAKMDAKMEAGFAKMEIQFAEVKGEIKTLDTKIDERTKALEDKIDERTKALEGKIDERDRNINTKFDSFAKEIVAEIDKRSSIIETKIDAQAKEVSTLQQRVSSGEADRARLITGLMGLVIGTLITLGVQKLFSSEPSRNSPNRSAIEYIPEYPSRGGIQANLPNNNL